MADESVTATAAGYRVGMEDGCIERHSFEPPCELAPEQPTTAATGIGNGCDCHAGPPGHDASLHNAGFAGLPYDQQPRTAGTGRAVSDVPATAPSACGDFMTLVGMAHPIYCRRQDSHGPYAHRALTRIAGGGTALVEWDSDTDEARNV